VFVAKRWYQAERFISSLFREVGNGTTGTAIMTRQETEIVLG